MNNKPLVLMTHELPSDWIDNSLDDYDVILGDNDQRGIDDKLEKYLPEAAGIICLLDDPISAAVINQAQKLQVISSMAVGTDNIDVKTCTSRGIPVGHTPGVLTDGTADLTLGLLLSVSRQLTIANQDARVGKWSSWEPTGWLGRDLKDSTVGIIGLGKIGTAVAERLKPFGCKIIFTNRRDLPEVARKLNAFQVDLDQLLSNSDFICLHVPLNEDTKGMIGEDAFSKMKKNAILINAARGQVVDTDALYTALQSKKILAAGLDVTDPEPLPPDHPLYQLPNCFITPHIGSATVNTRREMAAIAFKNLHAGILGNPLPYCVNPEIYNTS